MGEAPPAATHLWYNPEDYSGRQVWRWGSLEPWEGFSTRRISRQPKKEIDGMGRGTILLYWGPLGAVKGFLPQTRVPQQPQA